MIIVRLLSPELLVGFSTTKLYSGVGADIVMESITPAGKPITAALDIGTLRATLSKVGEVLEKRAPLHAKS
jgi:hypothetical protein